ncbi:MAG TPA: archaeosine biosynthesis radical SAM protein RaSEA [Methanocorpusculum sp.]|nr:archaeosine biosynthesis radical SAM protein RaSEA [Methanocorpusculum sp.]
MSSLIKPLASWKGKDRYFGEVLPSFTGIFLSGGWRWNQCRMCSYKYERNTCASQKELIAHMKGQIDWIAESYVSDEYMLGKIFTSGSVFDLVEVPSEVLDSFGDLFSGKSVIAESRADYITEDALSRFLSHLDQGQPHPLTIAIGLETTSDSIREKSINKGFSFTDFIYASDICHAAGVGVKAYLLMKPLFLTEREAIEDMQQSIAAVAPYADMISMNLCTVQRRTELEQYWQRGSYRPPYLWSAVKVLLDSDISVSCDPIGGGFRRGPHNCGICDKEIIAAINEYSLTADKRVLQTVWDMDCSCKKEWEYVLDNETPWNMPLTE